MVGLRGERVSVVEKPTLLDVPAYTMRQVDDIASVLVSKMEQQGFAELPVDEQVELRLLRTLLDGFA
jgi:hypothetical protein